MGESRTCHLLKELYFQAKPVKDSLKGLRLWGHSALFSKKEKKIHPFLISFLKEGFLQGVKFFYLYSRTNPDRIRQEIQNNGINIQECEARGQVVFLLNETPTNDVITRLTWHTQEAQTKGFARFLMIREMDLRARTGRSREDFLGDEARLREVLLDKYPFSSISEYQTNQIPWDIYLDIFLSHQHIITDDLYSNPYYIPPKVLLEKGPLEKHVCSSLVKENKKEESLMLLKNLCEHASQPFFAFYGKGDLLTCNQAFLDLLNYTREEISKLHLDRDLTPSSYHELDRQKQEALLKSNQPQNYWKEYQKKGGERIPVEIHLHQSKDQYPWYFYSLVTDISHQKKNEEMMGFLSHAVEQSQSAISIVDKEERILYANPSYSKITNYPREEILGEKVSLILKGRKKHEDLKKIWERVQKGEEWKEEFLFQRKGKGSYWGDLRVSPVKNENQEITHFLTIHEDISLRKNSEEKMQILYQELKKRFQMENNLALIAQEFLHAKNFHEAIFWVFQKIRTLLSVDRILLILFSQKDLDTLQSTDSHSSSSISWIDASDIPWIIRNLKRGEILAFNKEEDFPEEAQGEKERYLSLSIISQSFIPIMRKDRLLGTLELLGEKNTFTFDSQDLVFLKTITEMIALLFERKKMEEKIINSNNKLRKTLQELQFTQSKLIQQERLAGVGQLAAGVAHEINNPLGFVISNIETLERYVKRFYQIITAYREFRHSLSQKVDSQPGLREIQDLEVKNQLDFILEDLHDLFLETRDGLDRIKKIVEGLRFFSRSYEKEEFEEYHLNEGIQNTLVMAKNEYKYHASLQLDLSPLPPILAISGQINQVLLNIIMNGAQAVRDKEFSSKERGSISIKTFEEDGQVVCQIEDNGIGIEEDLLKNIFNPFFTTKEVGKGLGLGLSISHEIIVVKHQGSITVKSKKGEGSTFTIKIPVNRIVEEGRVT